MAQRFAVILAGGKGERFWPLSTSRRPKQLLALVDELPLLALAVNRLHGLIPPERIFILTNADLVAACREAAPTLPPEQVIGEPVGRDTAPAVALAAALVRARDPEGVFCILTADHVIGDPDLFRRTLAASMDLAAREDVLLTIGIPPTEPSTGFGYIEAGDELPAVDGVTLRRVCRFVEKPSLERAKEYVASGRFHWNSGMFVWSVRSICSALGQHRPALLRLVEAMSAVAGTPAFATRLGELYPPLEKISIDYAVMEKASNIVVARGDFPWDDVGSWPALEHHFPQDAAGNTAIGHVRAHDAGHNIVFSRERLTGLVGVRDLIVVQAEGATLICHRDRAQDVKKLVERLKAEGGHERVL